MLHILLQPLHHRGKENIAIRFGYNKEISHKLKMVADVRWSQTHRCWYVPLTKKHYQLVVETISGLAPIDAASLRCYLEQRKVVKPVAENKGGISQKRSFLIQTYPLCKENLEAFRRFQQHLYLKAYSKKFVVRSCQP